MAEETTWHCSCGTENEGKFCTNCGKPRPGSEEAAPVGHDSVTDDTLSMPPVQPPELAMDQTQMMLDQINQMKESDITEQTKALQHEAKVSRNRAAFYNALALRDASMIIGQSTKALANPSSLGDKVSTVKELMSYAQAAQSLLNAQKQASKARAQLQQAADKKFKDAGKVSKAEEQAFDQKMGIAQ